jgi:hypothetical protein
MTSINKIKMDKIKMDKIKIIDTIIENYPSLKRERENIINLIFKKNNNNERNIFDRIIINNKKYYRDKDNILFDSDLNIHGIIQIFPDSTQKIIIRHKINRKKYYKDFLEEQDLKMSNKIRTSKIDQPNCL